MNYTNRLIVHWTLFQLH